MVALRQALPSVKRELPAPPKTHTQERMERDETGGQAYSPENALER
jgi:hypothetical protein